MPTGRQGAVGLFSGTALVALLWWNGQQTGAGRIGDVGLLARPDGTPAVLSLRTVTALPGDGTYVVGRRSLEVAVRGDPAGLRLGDDVTVFGVVRDGAVDEERRELAPGRPAKKRLGYVGLALVFVALLATTRLTRHGWRATWPTS